LSKPSRCSGKKQQTVQECGRKIKAFPDIHLLYYLFYIYKGIHMIKNINTFVLRSWILWNNAIFRKLQWKYRETFNSKTRLCHVIIAKKIIQCGQENTISHTHPQEMLSYDFTITLSGTKIVIGFFEN